MPDEDDTTLSLIAELTRRDLVHVLESSNGPKDLVVEPSLLRQLDRIASWSLLQKHGVVRVQHLLSDDATVGPLAWSENATHRVYVVRPSQKVVLQICTHIRAERASGDGSARRFSVVWVDRCNWQCARELEREGCWEALEHHELSLSFLVIESDLLSLELPPERGRLAGHLYTASKALWQWQSLYGQVPNVYGLGEASEKLWAVMHGQVYQEHGEPRASADQSVSHLFIFDRNLDSVTPLLSALTYEARLHEEFGIQCGKILFGPEVDKRLRLSKRPPKQNERQEAEVPTAEVKPKAVPLSNSDPVFSAVRNLHMVGVFPWLSAKAKQLQAAFDRGAQASQISEMKAFVRDELSRLRAEHSRLEMHIAACEVVLERAKGAAERLALEHALVNDSVNVEELTTHLETEMCRAEQPWKILQLACLWSLCAGGLSTKDFRSFRQHFCQAFGLAYLPALHELLLAGLLTERTTMSIDSLQQLAKSATTTSTASLSTAGRIFDVARREFPGLPKMPSTAPLTGPPVKYLTRRLLLTPTSGEPPVDVRQPTKMSYVFSGAWTPPFAQVCFLPRTTVGRSSCHCTQVVANVMARGWVTSEARAIWGKAWAEQMGVPIDKTTASDGATIKMDKRVSRAIAVFFVGGVTYSEVAALRLLAQMNNVKIYIMTTHILVSDTYLKVAANVEL